jgi:hypothetical protein
MRSLKEREVNYDKLVIGSWYHCVINYEHWYFKFVGYNDEGGIVVGDCYSPYDDFTIFYSSREGEISHNSNSKVKQIRKIRYSWLMENVVNGRKIL